MRIYNTSNQLMAAGDGIAICWHPHTPGTAPKWSIMRFSNGRELATCKDAPYYDNQEKCFYVHSTRTDALHKAMAWVAEMYKVHGPWKRNKCGDYVPDWIQTAFPIGSDI